MRRWVVKLDYVGARKDVQPESLEKAETIISYFKGKPEEWKAGLPTSSKIIYRNLWPGIDLVYYGSINRMKYDFIIHPGADPSQIRLAYRGADSVRLTDSGRLAVSTPVADFEDDVPAAFQSEGQERREIQVSFSQIERGEAGRYDYGFAVGTYDPGKILVLDPAVLVYCGYIGGGVGDQGHGIAVDGQGRAYITGYTQSSQPAFPTMVGPDLTYNGGVDAFLAKVNAAGSALVYCGYIGGLNNGKCLACHK